MSENLQEIKNRKTQLKNKYMSYSKFGIPTMIDDGEEMISFVAEDNLGEKTEIPEILPILPLRNTVLFPGVLLPISIGRSRSVRLVKEAYQNTKLVGIVAQKDPQTDDPGIDDIYKTGTVASILKILEMPDGNTSIIIQGRERHTIEEIIEEEPYLKARVRIHAINNIPNDQEFEAILASLKDLSAQIIKLSRNIPPEASFAIKNIEDPLFLINYISSNSGIELVDKQMLLETEDIKERGLLLLKFLSLEVQKLELKDNIQAKVKHELNQQQREYILQQQMKTIQNELGGNPMELEVEMLKKKGKKKKWDSNVQETFEKELEKLRRINPASPEYSNQLNYLQLIVDLPWNDYTKDLHDLKRAAKILDEDHFGLEKVKDRILEHLAVLQLKGDLKSPILCLYGPPGVGKTSLGKSIASALKRKYVRMALGGMHDESEIRGHRRTYIGAIPGRIIQNIKKVKTSNPVFILDEIDKVGNDFRGDPSFALLEVLDPEQNNAFHDNYLEIEYDLSKVMFIATANSLAPIKPALRDRMELINVTGYIVEEKIEIAKRHLLPKQLENHGVSKKQLKLSPAIIEEIITKYTRESGVRQLDNVIAKIVRNIAKKIGLGEEYKINIDADGLREILGSPDYISDKYEGNEFAGVVTGLAWTSFGGEILFVETSLSKGNGNLKLTGNLGEVMRESAILALEYLKANCHLLNLPYEVFNLWNIHIHVPEGAIPKDGPSAGITMLTSIASAFRQQKVKQGLAMTGEITLRGKVLPVGGIKEKILAAKRANITDIILSEQNRKDIEEIKPIYVAGINFHFVKTMSEVLQIALLDEKVSNPVEVWDESFNSPQENPAVG